MLIFWKKDLLISELFIDGERAALSKSRSLNIELSPGEHKITALISVSKKRIVGFSMLNFMFGLIGEPLDVLKRSFEYAKNKALTLGINIPKEGINELELSTADYAYDSLPYVSDVFSDEEIDISKKRLIKWSYLFPPLIICAFLLVLFSAIAISSFADKPIFSVFCSALSIGVLVSAVVIIIKTEKTAGKL